LIEQGDLIAPAMPPGLRLARKQFKIWTSNQHFDPFPHAVGHAAVFATWFDD
jgi:hypothetical protein